MDELRAALFHLEAKHVRQILDRHQDDIDWTKEGCSLIHDLLSMVSAEVLLSCPQRRTIMHMLTNAGLDVNATDENGDTVLHLAVKLLGGDLEICEPLLQAGLGQHSKNQEGEDVASLITTLPGIPKKVQEVFEKYQPGLWQAVDQDDLLSVRKLINLWCRVDIEKEGKTLKELALDRGTENIIRLIIEIMPAMRLGHYVMADDLVAVKKLFSEKPDVNTEFRNLGDMGATPLFYAILQNNAELVSLLVERGAKRDALITLDEEEIPILFAALNCEMDPEVVKCLVPSKESNTLNLTALHYRGHFALHHCIKNDVPLSAVRHILRQGYSELLAARDVTNRCPRDLAVTLGKHEYVMVLDEAVHDWYLDSSGQHRKLLALLGFPHLREAQKDGVRACDVVQTMETSSPQAQFDTQLQQYQDQISRLAMAVEAGDVDGVRNNMHFMTEHPDSFCTCLAQSKPRGDGQPLLHKAVLQGHLDVTEYLVKVLTTTLKVKLDDIRDQCLRTALHYAYAMENGKPLYNLLLDYGASDFTMDKDCRSPLAFKHLKQHPEMQKLIKWHQEQHYNEPEPDPWSVKMRRPAFKEKNACPQHSAATPRLPAAEQTKYSGYPAQTSGTAAGNSWMNPGNPWLQGPPGNTWPRGPAGKPWAGCQPGPTSQSGYQVGGSQWQQGPPGNTMPPGWTPPGQTAHGPAAEGWTWMSYCAIL